MCKPKIKKMGGFLKALLIGFAAAITLAPFGIYVKEKYINNTRMINHESIHWLQQLELLIIFFYLWYFVEWLIKGILGIFSKGNESAYRRISFEREAYTNDDNLEYLNTRKHYAWLKRVFK